jgi:glycosyltransferase involved in cell wall biosynthesis/peptidoglycan/xylan/chitin deacetylase (PgdA/CDA1 family)
LDRNCWDFSIVHVNKQALESPDISVLLTTFNSEGTVARAIESVLCQTFQGFEIIIIDDGSTDETERIVRSFAIDGRVRLLSNPENRGLARSLNRGLELCRSPIAMQLDSDDWLEPNALECVYRRMRSHARVGAVYGRAISYDGENRVEEKGYQTSSDIECLEYPFIQVPRAYRASLLRKLGGWSIQDVFDGRYFEDRLTLARVTRLAHVSFIDEALCNVDLRANSLSRANAFRSKTAKLLMLSAEANTKRLGLEIFPEGRTLTASFYARRTTKPKRAWSIIIPAHARPELLEYSLRAWIESDLSDVRAEIIVIDDGSTKPLKSVVESTPGEVRYVRIDCRRGPAHARNVGASLARYKMLFFSDADRIVPPDVIRSHEARHNSQSGACVVVGGLFGRKAATFFHPNKIDSRVCRKLLEQFRFDEDRFRSLADACLANKAVRMVPTESPHGMWDLMEQVAFMDPYLSQWAVSILACGWEPAEPYRFLRLGTGNLSMSATTFSRVGKFDSTIQPMEDWEFGVRALKSKVEIVSAPEAEPYHQLHEVDPFLSRLHAGAMKRFRKKHPKELNVIFDTKDSYGVPGVDFIRNNGVGPSSGLRRPRKDESKSPYCALTFDDGPHRIGTPCILQALRSYRAVGTFFVLGALIPENRNLLRWIVESGCEVGVHGWTHQRVDGQTSSEIVDDLSRTISVIHDACGKAPRFCRPSYGIATPAYLAAAEKVGLQPVGWDISSRDWQDLGLVDLVANLALQSINEKVILFHDGCGGPDSSANVLHWLLRHEGSNHAKFVGISEYARNIHLPNLICSRATIQRI